jgi:hypothetical protein
MSIKVATQVWQGSRHKSGNLVVLLAVADHADDQGKAWPGVRLLARKARLSERHTRRCLADLLASGELEILPQPAPSGGKWYQIRLDQLTADNLSIGTSASDEETSVSGNTDADDRADGTTYIVQEPSIKSSEQSGSQRNFNNLKQKSSSKPHRSRMPDSLGLISPPKNGF